MIQNLRSFYLGFERVDILNRLDHGRLPLNHILEVAELWVLLNRGKLLFLS